MRCQRFNVPFSEPAKKASYTERFGPTNESQNSSSENSLDVCSIDSCDKKDEHHISSTVSKPEQIALKEAQEHQSKKFKTGQLF